MSTVDSKLRRFESNIINKAETERDTLLSELEAESKKSLGELRVTYTKSARAMYAKEMDDVRKEARVIISEAKNARQSSVVSKRSEIIDSVFNELELKLKEYVRGEEYEKYFTDKLDEAVNAALSLSSIPRKAELVFAPYDYDNRIQLAGSAAQRLMGRGVRVSFHKSETDFIGGCIVRLPNLGRVIDNSMKSDIMLERERFLSWSHLSV